MSVFTDKNIKNKRFVWDFKKYNVKLENPPTHKRRDDISVALLVWMSLLYANWEAVS